MTKHWLLTIVLGTALTGFYTLSRLVHDARQGDPPTLNEQATVPVNKSGTPHHRTNSGDLDTSFETATNPAALARKTEELDERNRLAGAEIAQTMLKSAFLDGYVARSQKLFEPLYAEWQTDEATIQRVGEVLRQSRVMDQTARTNTTMSGYEQNQYLSAVRSQTNSELSQLVGKQRANRMLEVEDEAVRKNWKSALQQSKREDE